MTDTQKNGMTKRLAGGPALLIACSSALAMTDTARFVDRLGVQGAQAYFSVSPALSVGCLFGDIYFDISTEAGQSTFAQLQAAKIFSIQLSRIDYTQITNGTCTLDLAEVECGRIGPMADARIG
jgi:hypothetical protein